MSTISKRSSVQTLKGLFTVPKQTHARNFLRENKLSLRDMQRITDKKEASVAENNRNSNHRGQPQAVNGSAHRRSISQHRLQTEKGPYTQTRPRSSSHNRRIATNQQQPQSQQFRKPSEAAGCPNCIGDGVHVNPSSNNKMRTQLEVCDREIQTDDIYDEQFLSDALKKCNYSKSQREYDDGGERLTDLQINNDNNLDDFDRNDDLPIQSGESGDDMSARSFQTVYENRRELPSSARTQRSHMTAKGKNDNLLLTNRTNRSNVSNMSKVNFHSNGNEFNMNGGPSHYDEEELNNNMDGISLKSKHDRFVHPHQHQQQQQQFDTQSVRSRQTIHSVQSNDSLSKKRSTGSVHKLGSRDDVRLPRYLEREKREKEEKRMRDLERDPNCPPGHISLTEDERRAALSGAQKKFDGLISELNRMPMTNQTLRVRTRKAEIEKELGVIESDIRAFSKPKVYVKLDEDDS